MRALALSVFAAILCVSAISPASGQNKEADKNQKLTSENSDKRSGEKTAPAAAEKTEEQPIFIHLVGGGKLQVEEARETRDGIWYKRGGVTTLLDPNRVIRIERSSPTEGSQRAVVAQDPNWTISDWGRVQTFFLTRFGRQLPISTFGQSALHDRWGLDHRQGIDVGLHPDSGEGAALIEFLRSERIPYLAFRGPVPRVSTGPHIHIGRASHRYLPR